MTALTALSGIALLAVIAGWTRLCLWLACREAESPRIARRERNLVCDITAHNAACTNIQYAAACAAHGRYHAGQSEDENNRQYARDVRNARKWDGTQAGERLEMAEAAGGCGRWAIMWVVYLAGVAAIISVWPG